MPERSESSRPLGLLDLVCIGINAIVGSSVFLFPGRLAAFLGPASVVSFGLTGLLLVSVALCFAEASSRFDRPGGSYLYAREAFGDWVGFGIGWVCWAAQIFGWATVANGIAVYLGYWDPSWARPVMVKGIAAAVILTMGALNYRGVKLGAWTSNTFTVAKLLPLLAFAFIGLPGISLAHFHPFAPHGWAPMGKACFLAYFAFQGFESIPVPAGEVDRPERNVPLATVIALLAAAALYMLIQTAAVGLTPALDASPHPLADAASFVFGPVGASIMIIGAVLSMTGYNAGDALTCPRYLVALAEDGHLPEPLARRHPRFQSPYLAISLTTALTLCAALAFDFNKLVDFSNVVVCAQYIATCASVPFLRRRPGWSLPGGWLVPALGIAATLWLGMQGEPAQIVWSLALLALGFVVRAACAFRSEPAVA